MSTAFVSEPASLADDRNLSAQEADQAGRLLEQTREGVLGATKGLSEAQWKFKPAADRWSIAEILDHVLIIQERVLGPVLEQVAAAPPPPAGVERAMIDALVINHFPNRLMKFSAPQFLHPADQIAPAELLDRLARNCAQLSERLDASGLRQHAIEGAPLKAVTNGAFTLMDGYQWILAAASHTERHTKQMLEVKAHPGYPGN